MVEIFWLPGGPREDVSPLRARVVCSSGLAIAMQPMPWLEAAILVPEERAVLPPAAPLGMKRKRPRRKRA